MILLIEKNISGILTKKKKELKEYLKHIGLKDVKGRLLQFHRDKTDIVKNCTYLRYSTWYSVNICYKIFTTK